jgi:hypothetical protein
MPEARSPWLIRLQLAMSDGYMADAFAKSWNWARHRKLAVTGCQLQRVFPRKNDEFLIEYNVGLSGTDGQWQQPVLAELINGGLHKKRACVLRKRDKLCMPQLAGQQHDDCVEVLPDPGLLVRLPGLDTRLTGLGLLHQPESLRQSIAGIIGCPVDRVEDTSSVVLGHRLGRRCIARCHYHLKDGTPNQSVIVKFYKARGGLGATVYNMMQALWDNGWNNASDARIPRPLKWCPESNSLWMEDVKAKLLPELPVEQHQNAVRAAGRVLARLHQSPIQVGKEYTGDDEIALLDRWVRLTSETFPDRAGRLSAAMSQIRLALRSRRNSSTALLHRDYYEKQVLVGEKATTLIDFDTLRHGDPALDIGNYLAHLHLQRLQGVGELHRAEEAFLAGYDCVDKHTTRGIGVYTASTRLRLACLYSFWPQWSHVSEPMLERISDDLVAAV